MVYHDYGGMVMFHMMKSEMIRMNYGHAIKEVGYCSISIRESFSRNSLITKTVLKVLANLHQNHKTLPNRSSFEINDVS